MLAKFANPIWPMSLLIKFVKGAITSEKLYQHLLRIIGKISSNSLTFRISEVSTGFVIVSKEDCDNTVPGTDRQDMFSKLEKDLIEQVPLPTNNSWPHLS